MGVVLVAVLAVGLAGCRPGLAVTSFSPGTGSVGSAVVIQGAKFTGLEVVRFNGVSAPFSNVTDTSLTATVPSGATTGPISVSVAGSTATSAAVFTVVPSSGLPAGFTDSVVFSGLNNPAAFAFAPDGKVFVANRTGYVDVFDSVSDTTPTRFADLTVQVYNQYDRGMLGIAVDPQWPTRPYVYVLYAYDGDPGGPAPKWGVPGQTWDSCPDPPGSNTLGCMISSRLSRLTASGDQMVAETVLVSGWCQQFSSHSVGALKFGPDGALYASAGEGASYNYSDYGQTGNPCGDPPGPAGTGLTVPTAEGGRLRSQSPRRAAGQPVVLTGTLIRVDPNTGAGVSGNPMFTSSDANRRRIVAYGLRNPFRFTFRPGTSEVWIGDVGGGEWEEIDRVPTPTPTTAYNFGWPCYEGTPRQGSFDNLNLNSCENLYAAGSTAVTAPYYSYRHRDPVAPNDGCANANGAALTGLAFYTGSSYPAPYQGALFFGDYARECIWYLPKGANGLPDPTTPRLFMAGPVNPVDMVIGSGGDIFYADLIRKEIRRIRYTGTNTPPVATATATPSSGALPLSVAFSAAPSFDPDGDALTYSWDLNGDGVFGDSTAVAPSRTYTAAATVTVGLRVTDARGAMSATTVVVSAGNTAPVPTITAPTSALRWKVGDRINFAGGATDVEDGSVPASRLSWSYVVHHCPSACHSHPAGQWTGVASGGFDAPDHEYPAFLELILTATDAGGLSASKSALLIGATSQVTLQSNPPGLTLDISDQSGVGPYTVTALAKSNLGIVAPSPQVLNGVSYSFASWSDGGAAAHNITTPSTGTATYTANFTAAPLASGPRDDFDAPTLDTSVWAVTSGGSSVAVVNGRLEIVHPAGAWTGASVETKTRYNQTGKSVQVQVPRVAGGGVNTPTIDQTSVTIRVDDTHFLSFVISDGTIAARYENGAGEVNLTPSWPTYSATTMQWLRFREYGGRVYWEYASGAATPGPWTALASIPNPFALTSVALRLKAGSNLGATDVARFDNVSTSYATAVP